MVNGAEDIIPITVSNQLIPDILDITVKGKYARILGKVRTYDKQDEYGRRHLEVTLFVDFIDFFETEQEDDEENVVNLICLDGRICKPPVYRLTPFGRQITDLLIAVNRKYQRSSYIPCIAWGKTALYARELIVGDRVKLYGRIQSRQYFKRFSKNSKEGEYKTVYEISIMGMKKVVE